MGVLSCPRVPQSTLTPVHRSSIQNIFRKRGIQVHHTPRNTIRRKLVHPKDKETIDQKNGIIYCIKCKGCDQIYIGETGRNFKERFKEHLKNPSPVYSHHENTGHGLPTLDECIVLGREGAPLKRNIKEAIHIKAKNPALNRNIGQYELSSIWLSLIQKDKRLNSNQ